MYNILLTLYNNSLILIKILILTFFIYIKICIKRIEGMSWWIIFNTDLNWLYYQSDFILGGRLLNTFMPKE
jgi:hypothetical protein